MEIEKNYGKFSFGIGSSRTVGLSGAKDPINPEETIELVNSSCTDSTGKSRITSPEKLSAGKAIAGVAAIVVTAGILKKMKKKK